MKLKKRFVIKGISLHYNFRCHGMNISPNPERLHKLLSYLSPLGKLKLSRLSARRLPGTGTSTVKRIAL